MPYKNYDKMEWKMDGTYYPDDFNRIENGLSDIEKYSFYREKQTQQMGAAMKKLRTNQNVKIAVRGDSVMFGYNTATSGEDGIRRVTNTVMADRNPSEYAKTLGYDGLYFYGKHPLKKQATAEGSVKASSEVTGNGSVKRTEVQIPHVMIQALNKVFENHITYVDRVYTGDSAVTSYMRYDAANADIEIINLGINDALAAFLGTEYVGQVPEFMKWYTNLIEREIEAGVAIVIVTPIIQTTVSTYDTDARTTVDVYEKILCDIAKLYGIPVIDGNELNHNFSNRMIIDFTHFNAPGNSSVGKKLAAPFIAGDLLAYEPMTDGSWLGCRPQEDSVNVHGNACIEYTAKAPTFPLLLDNNDLYDTGVNRISQGLGVYMNYPLDGAVTEDLGFTNEQLFEKAPDINVLWRQADLYARNGNARWSDGYTTAYNTRMSFLQGKHGYNAESHVAESGEVTWAFYIDKCGMVVVPSIWMDKSSGGKVEMELDFHDMVPEGAGAYLSEMDIASLQTALQEVDGSYSPSDSDTKETLIAAIKEKKGYNVSQDEQGCPDNLYDWLDTDEIDYAYTEPMTCEIGAEDLSAAGYYGKRQLKANAPVIKITTKGWHTITLKSNSKDKFIAFGLSFMSLDEYKRAVK